MLPFLRRRASSGVTGATPSLTVNGDRSITVTDPGGARAYDQQVLRDGGVVGTISAGATSFTDFGSGYAAPDVVSHNFEDGTFGGFSNFYDASAVTVATDQAHAGTHAAKLHYVTAGLNRSFNYAFVAPHNALTEAYARGYFRLGAPVSGSEPDQRKLMYFMGDQFNNADWFMIPTTFNYTLQFNYACVPQGISDTPVHPSPAVVFSTNTWYGLEVRVKLNSAGNSDGVLEFWIYDTSGTQIGHQQFANLNIRGSSTHCFENLDFGKQVDTALAPGVEVDEYRWWDDAAISTQRIGP